MPAAIQINSQTFRDIAGFFQGLWARAVRYYQGCTRFQQFSWMAVGSGLVFVLLAIILW